MISSAKPCFYHELETRVTSVTMVTLFHSSTSLGSFSLGNYNPFSYVHNGDLHEIMFVFFHKEDVCYVNIVKVYELRILITWQRGRD